MKALILNSGKGSRMGDLTKTHPKCMTEIASMETIISRQLRQVAEQGISEVIITTGPFEEKLIHYVESLGLPLSYTFVRNPNYENTNYIYSMYLARKYLEDTDILLMHGDLVVENDVFFSFWSSHTLYFYYTIFTTVKVVIYRLKSTFLGYFQDCNFQ